MSEDDSPVSNFVNQAVNVTTQVATGGLVGYENGKFGKGYITHGADEVVGEVTGRNAARKAIMEGKDAVTAEAAQKDQDLKDKQAANMRKDVASSQAAAATRLKTAAQSKQSSNYLGASPAKDFLGI